METAKVLNTSFSNVVQNLKISRYPDSDSLMRNIKDPALKAVLNYRIHPCIIAVVSKCTYASILLRVMRPILKRKF